MTNKMMDICLVEGCEELILASAPFGEISVGDLVTLEGCGGEVFKVTKKLSYPVEEGGQDWEFLSDAHGTAVCSILQVYRTVWEVDDDD